MTEQQIVALVRQRMAYRPKIIRMFENCYRDTLENAVHYQEDGQAFLLTGDIPAMWLRDSTNQLRPYLLTAADTPRIRAILEGVPKKAVPLHSERPLCQRLQRRAGRQRPPERRHPYAAGYLGAQV